MSQQIEDGGQGCPQIELRDWFAGQALNGMLSCPAPIGDFNTQAKVAYRFADAMLAARQAFSEFRVGQTVRVKNSGHKFEIDSITETIAGKTVYEFDGQIWNPEEIEAIEA